MIMTIYAQETLTKFVLDKIKGITLSKGGIERNFLT